MSIVNPHHLRTADGVDQGRFANQFDIRKWISTRSSDVGQQARLDPVEKGAATMFVPGGTVLRAGPTGKAVWMAESCSRNHHDHEEESA